MTGAVKEPSVPLCVLAAAWFARHSASDGAQRDLGESVVVLV